MSSTEPLTQEEEALLDKLLSNPLFFPGVFKEWISELTRGQVTPGLPFSDILKSDTLKGTINFFANISPTYPVHLTWKDAGTMTIPGPCEALIFFMASSNNWSGDYGYLALSVNGAAPSNAQRLAYRGVAGRRVFGARAQYVVLPNETNNVKLQVMKDGSGDVDFKDLAVAVFRIFLANS